MDGAMMSEHIFTPDTDSQREFRDALGRFATGVTVVTTHSAQGPLGITANSFAALSLDPALVMWAPGKYSRRFAAFAEASSFAIHVLGAEQLSLAQHFAGDGLNFDGIDMVRGTGGTPLLSGCLARFECAHHATHPGGDHVIVVGRVLRVATRPGAALSFFSGAYGALDAD